MRVAHNDDELAQLIMKDIQSAVQLTEKYAIADMGMAISHFYAGGYPKMYIRTYQLAKTPKTSGVRVLSNKHVQFDAYLDDSGGYTTGKHPSMAQVLDLTDKGSSPGLRPAVGSTGYWDMANKYIEKHFDDCMKQYFD